MGALHVVGKDLELGLGVHLGVVGQQQIPVGLLAVGLLSLGGHEHLAVEHGVGRPRNDPLVDLAAGATRMQVPNRGVIVDQLPASGHVESVELALGVAPLQRHIQVVPRQRPAEGDREGMEPASLPLMNLGAPDVEGPLAIELELDVLRRGPGAQHQFGHGVGEALSIVHGGVGLDHAGPRPAIQNQQVPGTHHPGAGRGIRDEEQMNRGFQVDVGRQVQTGAVLKQGLIERREGAALHAGEPAEEAL